MCGVYMELDFVFESGMKFLHLKNWSQTHTQKINEDFLKCQNQDWSVDKKARYNTTFLFIQVKQN
jgi:hypothetical protein